MECFGPDAPWTCMLTGEIKVVKRRITKSLYSDNHNFNGNVLKHFNFYRVYMKYIYVLLSLDIKIYILIFAILHFQFGVKCHFDLCVEIACRQRLGNHFNIICAHQSMS